MIRIVVDSSADYRLEEIKEKQLERINIHIQLGDQDYVEGVNLKRDELYEKMQQEGCFPTTSQPSPQDYLEIFEDAREKGDKVICITVSSVLSGTWNCANLAKEMAEYDGIYIIDSLNASYGIRFLADHACVLRDRGVEAEQIVRMVEELKPRIRIMAVLDTLEYLYRGGRLSRASAAIGEMVNLKPVVEITVDGQVGVKGKCLGGNKAAAFLLRQMQEQKMDPRFPVYTLYSYGTTNCEKLESRMNKEGLSYSDRLQLGAAIGTHAGPGAYGVAFVIEE